MASVELKQVSKEYEGGIPAVEKADLVVEDKEFLVLVGPSGCGKSTTLRMIAGLEDVTEGEIFIGGRKVNQVQPKDRDIAMVFQNYALYPHMTVYKNMAFGLKLRKYPKAEIRQRVEAAARTLGIEDLLDRRPKALSGGQRQRVAVGRAIVRQPQVFLFDEPLSNLDAQLRLQMRAEISKLHTRLQTTMIYVTHDQVEAMTMGDRIVVMLDGRIQQVATPSELYRHPANKFVAGFIGSPPMNFAEGSLAGENGGVWLRDESKTLNLAVDSAHQKALEPYLGKTVHFGIRPEALQSEGTAQGARLDTTVDVVEPMGAETYLYLRVGTGTFVARVPADVSPAVEDSYPIGVAMSKAHYFDCETGKRIV